MLRALGFEGFACSEFKRDPRDGRYKIVDVNGRHNLSGLLAVRCGVNFPLLQYRHLLYGEVPRPAPFREGMYWTDVVRDAGYGLRYLLHERHAPWTQLRPYLGPGCDAIFDRSDLRPFLTRCGFLLRSAVRLGREGAEPAPPAAGSADAA
jgi:predicted ATP-grasp superfamily ATP-dependent carboligase